MRLAAGLSFVVLAWAPCTLAKAQSVLLVDTNDPGVFGSIQAAIDAAAPGDTVVIRPGVYGGFAITGTSIHVTGLPDPANPGDLPNVGAISITSLQPDQQVVIRGLEQSLDSELLVQGCAGSVLVDTARVGALRVIDCSQVALIDLIDLGSSTSPFGETEAPSDISTIVDSSVDLFDCRFFGNSGSGDPGLSATSSSVYFSGCSLNGGRGVPGLSGPEFCTVGGPGGAGLQLVDSFGRAIDSTFSGGLGGLGGTNFGVFGPTFCDDGTPGTSVSGQTLVQFPDSPSLHQGHRMVVEQAVQGGTLELSFEGAPFEDVILFVSLGLESLFLFPWNGPVQINPGQGFFFLAGTLAVDGTLTLDFPVSPSFAPIRSFPVQPFFVDTTGLLTDHVGGVRWVELFGDNLPLYQ